MENIEENVDTAFYIRHVYSYQLCDIEDDTVIVYYTNNGSPWINDLSAAEKWLSAQETKRLNSDNTNRPSTKWEFLRFSNVDVKVVFDHQPLLGTGPLPDWLRNLTHGRSMVALDTLCLWRCIAVHRGARLDRSTTAARGLAKSFFNLKTVPTNCPKTSLDELDRVERHLNQVAAFSDWLGIRVYAPELVEDAEVVWHLRRNPPAQLKNTIGIFGGHAFVIKDIEKLAKTYACTHCYARFTKACNLQRHSQTCCQGKTITDCPGEKVEAPQTAFEKTFIQTIVLPKNHYDGLIKKPSGVKFTFTTQRTNMRRPVYCHLKRTKTLRKAGYRVIEVWACEVGGIDVELPRPQTQSFPHAILYDFEAYGYKNQRKEPTPTLTIENPHVLISVSVGDALERDPTHICEKDPAELVRKFMEELERRGKNIRTEVRAMFMPDDVRILPKAQRIRIKEWCDQVPVLGFNSGRYDLNLNREHLAERLSDTTGNVRVAKNGNKIMFLLTQGFRFLDIINYLAPGVSCEKWTKAYECTAAKSWFPYGWFDSHQKLEYPGVPDYPAWYSRLKEEYTLKLSEWVAFKRLFKEKAMRTFADWLRYYNNLDVAPGLDASETMRAFYTEKGIDILKDAVSIPGVSLHYLLQGAVERGGELYSPGKEAYEMLKGAVVGGPSLVFTRYHEVGVTRLRSH